MTLLREAVLDACVLVNFSLCDTLLRLAEDAALFVPKWSNTILDETERTLANKLGWPPDLARRFPNELRRCFPESLVTEFEHLLPTMHNDPKDRHVLAAAVRSAADVIVTFNLRHFDAASLQPWGLTALHPDDFLLELHTQSSAAVIDRLRVQAEARGRSLLQLLNILRKNAPRFADVIANEAGD
jgi:predicted nucleic acid-binding protein